MRLQKPPSGACRRAFRSSEVPERPEIVMVSADRGAVRCPDRGSARAPMAAGAAAAALVKDIGASNAHFVGKGLELDHMEAYLHEPQQSVFG